MAYFLGKDCDVYITSETDAYVNVTSASGDAAAEATVAGVGEVCFAAQLSDGVTAITGWDEVQDLTGVDLSIGAMDEDTTYFGMRSIQKTEIKKETTLTLTRKKTDNTWDGIFNYPARWGGSGTTLYDGLSQPTVNQGFRLHVQLKSGSEIFCIRGACVQAHTTSVNADGTSEETMEFMSYINPKVASTVNVDAIGPTEL